MTVFLFLYDRNKPILCPSFPPHLFNSSFFNQLLYLYLKFPIWYFFPNPIPHQWCKSSQAVPCHPFASRNPTHGPNREVLSIVHHTKWKIMILSGEIIKEWITVYRQRVLSIPHVILQCILQAVQVSYYQRINNAFYRISKNIFLHFIVIQLFFLSLRP